MFLIILLYLSYFNFKEYIFIVQWSILFNGYRCEVIQVSNRKSVSLNFVVVILRQGKLVLWELSFIWMVLVELENCFQKEQYSLYKFIILILFGGCYYVDYMVVVR